MAVFTRSRVCWLLAGLAFAAGLLLAARFWLGGYVVRSVLQMAGASEIRFQEVRGTPWWLEITNLEFRVRSHAFAARRVTLQRESWWQASLGDVRVEGASLPVVLDGSDVDPLSWDTYGHGGLGDEPVPPPFGSLDLQGDLIVRMAGVPERAIAVKLEGRPKSGTSWIGSLLAEAEGFRLAGNGSLLRAGQELDFQVHSAELDLANWSPQVQRLVSLPGGPWELGGRLTGVAEGKVTAKRFAATARVTLHGASMRSAARDIAAEGAEADLEFSDLWKLRTSSGRLRLAELRFGRLSLREVEADFGLWNGRQINLAHAAAKALGGRVEAESFGYLLGQDGLDFRLNCSGLQTPDLLALLKPSAPRLSGRLEGSLALRVHANGVQVSGGWLGLESGGGGEMQVNATTLLRSGAQMDAATERVFKAAAGQNVLVRLEEFRLDIRPPGLPLGTSVRCRVQGRVDDQRVGFLHHVNGAAEGYWVGGR